MTHLPTPVTDNPANANEYIDHAVATIGRGAQRRKVFEAIYAGRRQTKTVQELADTTGLNRVRVLQEGGKLAANSIVTQTKDERGTCYSKLRFFQHHKRKVLSLVDNPSKLKELPTKRRPQVAAPGLVVQVPIRSDLARIRQITIDDIDSFKAAHTLAANGDLPKSIKEKQFKEGIQAVIGQTGKFTDWGGEKNDLYTTRLRIDSRRRATAFAFKGPGKSGPLTPGKLGKNGDQIQRLFQTPADVFLVQYWTRIEETVVEQMETHAIARSVYTGKEVLFGIIDGEDSNRVYRAYQSKF